MPHRLTDDQKNLLMKFGFRIGDSLIEYKKVNVELDPAELHGKTSEELQDFIKEKLRED